MASMAFTSTLTRFQAANGFAKVLRKPWGNRFSVFASPRPSQANRRYAAMATYNEAGKQGIDAAKKGGQQLKKDAAATADNAGQKMEDVAGKASEMAQDAASKVKQTAQDAAGKAKQTAENAWDTVKDTTQKIKETVVGKAEASAECVKDTVKEGAAKVDRAVNSNK